MKKKIKVAAIIIGIGVALLNIWGVVSKKKALKDDDLKQDCYEGAGKAVLTSKKTVYEALIKRVIDIVLSSIGILVLSPFFLILAVAIYIDDPGPILFAQKRVGLNKTFFKLYKFRSMKMSTPHDMPTHMLADPEQYITRVGKILRKYSLDELPQFYNILVGDISIVGPRPALWNQEDLVAERDKYGANDVMPGLTGWAQINGRDELEIPVKAVFDGEYVEKLRKNSLSGMIMDARCFFGTFLSVLKSDGVVEGGTGELNKQENKRDFPEVESTIGFGEPVEVDFSQKKRVLITGANSYIGESFEAYAKEHYSDNYEIDTIDMIDGTWREKDFSVYDTVFHVAGIAHADVGNVTDEVKEKYYAVNTDLAVETAAKAKADGVKQFVFMSSMIIYGESAPFGKEKMITADTKPEPANFYGDSKWQADKGVRGLADEDFNVLVLRPPMIYGKGSKGNYPLLAKLAKKLPVFPNVNNQRSMLYIENLCEFLCQVMLVGKGGVFFPQNAEYTRTADMVKEISEVAGKKLVLTNALNPFVWIAGKMPGKIGGLVNKAFGNCCYDKNISQYIGVEYQKSDVRGSMMMTEGENSSIEYKKRKVLMLASVASMIEQFNMSNIKLLLEMGYEVDVACNFKEGSSCSLEIVEKLKEDLNSKGVTCYQIDFTRSVFNLYKDWVAYKQVKELYKENKYDFVHCHSPIGGVIGRLASMGTDVKTVYTAHGFHFYKGAPGINWVVYFSIEWICSWMTDVLITINKEDYGRAKKHLHAKKVEYIPGVGIDVKKIRESSINKKIKRDEIGIPSDAILIISVGELNKNKNHEIIIKALNVLKDTSIYYIICGQGKNEQHLKNMIQSFSFNDRVKLLGFRTDVIELCYASDIFAFPSKREGLGLAALEAMAVGLPLITSNNHGINDYSVNGLTGYTCSSSSVEEFAKAISILAESSSKRKKFGEVCLQSVKNYDIEMTNKIMKTIYDYI